MARTWKDAKSDAEMSANSRKPREKLNRNYRRFKEHGPDPGDYCPECGEPTGFQSGFLLCQDCGWIDGGPDAIDFEFNNVA